MRLRRREFLRAVAGAAAALAVPVDLPKAAPSWSEMRCVIHVRRRDIERAGANSLARALDAAFKKMVKDARGGLWVE